jgi:hypothetical protein
LSNPLAPSAEHQGHHAPSRGNTLGSILDSSGAEVADERVLLYIHGTPCAATYTVH